MHEHLVTQVRVGFDPATSYHGVSGLHHWGVFSATGQRSEKGINDSHINHKNSTFSFSYYYLAIVKASDKSKYVFLNILGVICLSET